MGYFYSTEIRKKVESLGGKTTMIVLQPPSTNSGKFEQQDEGSAILAPQNRVLEWAIPTIVHWEDAWNGNVEGSGDAYSDQLKKNIQ